MITIDQNLLQFSGSGCGCRCVFSINFGGPDAFPVLHGEHLVIEAIQETIVVYYIIHRDGSVYDRLRLFHAEH